LSDNVVKLDKFRKSKEIDYITDEEIPQLYNEVKIGWVDDDDGTKSLHIVSTVSTVECLWMIDLAQKIIDSRPATTLNEHE
tara:strand:+ start:1019 stop:1261 length:243 start_codon:yes stop_codon:yes gene_type:complete